MPTIEEEKQQFDAEYRAFLDQLQTAFNTFGRLLVDQGASPKFVATAQLTAANSAFAHMIINYDMPLQVAFAELTALRSLILQAEGKPDTDQVVIRTEQIPDKGGMH